MAEVNQVGNGRQVERVCVYAASSEAVDPQHYHAARRLGEVLARANVAIVYGGGQIGSMGALADGALSAGGVIHGVIPRFMDELEWGHRGISSLEVVEHLHERKLRMVEGADAIVALPGGSGTLEELLEAITWKRLGLYLNPIVLVNVRGMFDPLIGLLDRLVDEGFMDSRHRSMWTTVGGPDEVLAAIRQAPDWAMEAREFATVRKNSVSGAHE